MTPMATAIRAAVMATISETRPTTSHHVAAEFVGAHNLQRRTSLRCRMFWR
jgi:hypothetical protein